MRLFFSILTVVAAAVSISAEIRLNNPGLPVSEEVVYTEKLGNRVTPLKQSMVFKTEGGKSYYEARITSADQDVFYKIDPASLTSFFSDVIERSPEATIRRTWELQQSTTKAKNDELVLSDFNTMSFSLRGFPWAKVNFAKLIFTGAGSAMSGFGFELSVQGKETVKVAGKSFETYKLQLSLSGLLGGFVPKSYFWYNAQQPHYLVKFEGSQGPGSPTRTLELQSYTATN